MDFVSIDTWTIIMQWGNLLLIVLIVRHFLFKPVQRILNQRKDEIDRIYSDAEQKQKLADNLKAEYTIKVSDAKEEAEDIVKTAVRKAKLKSETIIKDAHKRADDIMEKASENIEMEKREAVNEIKNDISDMAVSIAGQIIEKEMTAEDHENMIKKIIEKMG